MMGGPSRIIAALGILVGGNFSAASCGKAQDVFLGGLLGDGDGAGGSESGPGGQGGEVIGAAGGGNVPCVADTVNAAHLTIFDDLTGFGRTTTGGRDGCVIHVTSTADSGPGSLREALSSPQTAWIRFSVNNVILDSDINVTSNKTLSGSGGDVTITRYGLRIGAGVKNVIIHDLEFVGTEVDSGTGGTEGLEQSDDAILIEQGAENVWIHQCDFTGYTDGLIDIISGATNITVSYNHFYDHRRVMLIGNENGGVEDQNIRVTLHHNWFEGTESYHPRLRRGWVHSYNNYLQAWESFGSGSSEGGQLASEANVYDAGPDVDATLTTIADDTEPGNLRSVADVEMNGAIIKENNPDSVFEPSAFYEYEAETAGSELIATIESEAGTR
jgi:pectate lyase